MLPKPKNDTKPSATYKKYLFESVFSQTQFSTHYILQLVFSTIITTLGLLTNNSVVVIGAMLISPLFWPVMGIALGIITTRQNVLRNSAFSFTASFVLVVFFSALVAGFVPITELPGEVISRINPNIIDLFIALFTSIIGVIALYYPTISASATGVAISISLLPPLCVFGIGLSQQLGGVMLRSLLLFSTNVGAIVFMGVIVLYLLKIRPRKREEEARFRYGVLFSGILMILLSIPLSFYLRESVEQHTISEEIKRVMKSEIVTVHPDARVETLDIDFLSVAQNVPLGVSAKIYLPEDIYMTQSQRAALIDKLTVATEQNIDLELDIISTLSLQTDKDKARRVLRSNIKEVIIAEIALLEGSPKVSDVSVSFLTERTVPEKEDVEILISMKQFGKAPLSYRDLQSLKVFLEEKFEITANVDVEFLPVSRLNQTTLDPVQYEAFINSVEQRVLDLSTQIDIVEVSTSDSSVTLELAIPDNVSFSSSLVSELEATTKDILGEEYSLEVKISRFEIL